MPIPGELAPDLIDLSGLDQITSPLEAYKMQQVAGMGIPISPFVLRDQRNRETLLERILAQNEVANQQRTQLGNRQLDVDMRGQDVEVTTNLNSSFDPGNDEAMMGLLLNQEQMDPNLVEGLDQILASGDATTRGKTVAETNKAQAEAEAEPIKAQAQMTAAQKDSSTSGLRGEILIGPDGAIRDIKKTGPLDKIQPLIDVLPQNENETLQSDGEATPSVMYDKSMNMNKQDKPAELESSTGTGQRLIINSDGSGILIDVDGQRYNIPAEAIAAVRTKNGYQ